MPTKPAHKILSKEQAVGIFKLKCGLPISVGYGNQEPPNASSVAVMFGVTAKTVRDIWMGRTWYRETLHLDPSRSDARERLLKRAGRPKGAKDGKPRKPKQSFSPTLCTNSVLTYSMAVRCDSEVDSSKNCKISISKSTQRKNSFVPEQAQMSQQEFSDPFHDDFSFWTSTTDKHAHKNRKL